MKFSFFLSSICFIAASAVIQAIPVRVLAWDDEVAARKLALVDEKNTNELKNLHPLSRSAAIAIATSGEVPPCLQALDRIDKDGAPAMDPIPFPKGIKRPLIVLLPDPKAATGIRPLVIEDDIAGFRWGTIRVINTTGRQLLFKCETKVAPLPAKWTPVDIVLNGERRNVEVLMALREEPTKPLYSSIWEFQNGLRQLVFIMPKPNGEEGPVAFKFIMEHKVDVEADYPNADP